MPKRSTLEPHDALIRRLRASGMYGSEITIEVNKIEGVSVHLNTVNYYLKQRNYERGDSSLIAQSDLLPVPPVAKLQTQDSETEEKKKEGVIKRKVVSRSSTKEKGKLKDLIRNAGEEDRQNLINNKS